MLKIDFTQDMIFGFEGPNLCLLGGPEDFEKLSNNILVLTEPDSCQSVTITNLDYVELAGENVKVVFASRQKSDLLGKIVSANEILFELDDRYWERIFKFFVIMSWKRKTFYLNSFEDALRDLPLDQEVHLICSSEF